jgi:hypothetical protein
MKLTPHFQPPGFRVLCYISIIIILCCNTRQKETEINFNAREKIIKVLIKAQMVGSKANADKYLNSVLCLTISLL